MLEINEKITTTIRLEDVVRDGKRLNVVATLFNDYNSNALGIIESIDVFEAQRGGDGPIVELTQAETKEVMAFINAKIK